MSSLEKMLTGKHHNPNNPTNDDYKIALQFRRLIEGYIRNLRDTSNFKEGIIFYPITGNPTTSAHILELLVAMYTTEMSKSFVWVPFNHPEKQVNETYELRHNIMAEMFGQIFDKLGNRFIVEHDTEKIEMEYKTSFDAILHFGENYSEKRENYSGKPKYLLLGIDLAARLGEKKLRDILRSYKNIIINEFGDYKVIDNSDNMYKVCGNDKILGTIPKDIYVNAIKIDSSSFPVVHSSCFRKNINIISLYYSMFTGIMKELACLMMHHSNVCK